MSRSCRTQIRLWTLVNSIRRSRNLGKKIFAHRCFAHLCLVLDFRNFDFEVSNLPSLGFPTMVDPRNSNRDWNYPRSFLANLSSNSLRCQHPGLCFDSVFREALSVVRIFHCRKHCREAELVRHRSGSRLEILLRRLLHLSYTLSLPEAPFRLVAPFSLPLLLSVFPLLG